jgi:hypothetical protein
MLGVRPTPSLVSVRPRLLEGIDSLRARLRLNGHEVRLALTRTSGAPSATVNGRDAPVEFGALRLPRPAEDLSIEMRV